MSVVGHPAADRAEPVPDRAGPSGPAALLLGLGALGVLGAAVQLAAAGAPAAVAWAAVALLAAAGVPAALPRTGRAGRRSARTLALVVLVSAGTAVAERHLDPGGGGLVTASWYGHGRAPLAPGLLGQSALLVVLATVRRPGRRSLR